jgi:hypothetical protein
MKAIDEFVCSLGLFWVRELVGEHLTPNLLLLFYHAFISK